jgi:acyl carrier protein
MNKENRDSLREKVRTMLSRLIGKEIQTLDDGMELIRDLGFESIQIVQLFTEIQTSFGVNLAQDDYVLENVSDVGAIIQLIERRLPQRAQVN